MNKKLIIGCMGLGGGWNQNPITHEDEKQAQAVMETALECGIATFDHADIYTFGKAEQVFGNVLKQHPDWREHMIIQSKAGIVLGKGPNGANIYNNSKTYLLNQVDIILGRLQLDYLDTLLIHRPDALLNGYEVAETFRILKDHHKVKNFGVSNMSVSQMELIQHYWQEPLLANQIQLSLGHAGILDMGVDVNTHEFIHSGIQGMLEYAQIHDVDIQAYSSLDRGRFTKPLSEIRQEDQPVAVLLNRIAEKYNVSATAIALSWLFKIPNVQPIIGTTNPERIKESATALQVNLTHEEWYELYITSRGHKLP